MHFGGKRVACVLESEGGSYNPIGDRLNSPGRASTNGPKVVGSIPDGGPIELFLNTLEVQSYELAKLLRCTSIISEETLCRYVSTIIVYFYLKYQLRCREPERYYCPHPTP